MPVLAWAVDPSLVVAVVSVLVALAAMRSPGRFVSRRHRRETLAAMQRMYTKSKDSRSAVLPAFPPFLLQARSELEKQVETEGTRPDLLEQLRRWPGVSGTAAHEVIADEAKFRSLLSAVLAVRRWKDTAPEDRSRLIGVARRLVGQLNDFSQMVELGLFSQGDAFGQLHRSIAPACKAVEPLIWSESVDGRWGLRLLRMLLRAEHFNDVRRIHSISELRWGRASEPLAVVFHTALYADDYGRRTPAPRLAAMTWRARLVLAAERAWTRVVPRFGGVRLRRHARAESILLGRLRYAVEARLCPSNLEGWTLATLEAGLREGRVAERDRQLAVGT